MASFNEAAAVKLRKVKIAEPHQLPMGKLQRSRSGEAAEGLESWGNEDFYV